MGYYRDDLPLIQLILDDNGKRELDRLWNEFDYIADFSARTWTQYYFNQSGEVFGKGDESGSERPTDHAVTDAEVIFKMRDAYLAKAAADPTNDPVAPRPSALISTKPTPPSAAWKRSGPRRSRGNWKLCSNLPREPTGGRSTDAERADLLAYYPPGSEPKISYPTKRPSATRITSVLMEPDFLYRLDISNGLTASSAGARSRAARPSYLNRCPR